MKRFILGFVKVTGAIPMWLLMKRKTYFFDSSRQNRKIRGAAIIISNHKSMFDFPLMLCLFPFRRLHFLMAEILFERSKLFAWFLKMIGGIRVDRANKDLSFMGEAEDLLLKGKVVGIFPEARLERNAETSYFSPSVVYLALKTNTPIIPIYNNGVFKLFKRTRVIIGEDIYLNDLTSEKLLSSDELKRLCDYLQNQLLLLKENMEKQIENH